MTKIQKDTLGYLGVDYQYRLINAFVSDHNYFKDNFSIIDHNKFTDHYLKAIVGVMKDYYNKTEIVPSELGKFYSQLFELRQTGDYDDWKEVTEADVMTLAPTVEIFLDTLEELIKKDGFLD